VLFSAYAPKLSGSSEFARRVIARPVPVSGFA
jgi:hypothetical protein